MSITLSDMQNKCMKEIIHWYKEEPTKIRYVLAGYAGSGKTTLVKYVIQELGLENVAYCAYSGMASTVLVRNGNPYATTIHRTIYNTVRVQDKETKKWKYICKLKPKEDLADLELIVIDEWSMVPDKMIEELESFGVKCLYCGDPLQLPPIFGDNILSKRVDFFLTEIHRQALDNPIIYLSMLARNKETLQLGKYGDTVQVVNKMDISEDNLARLTAKADQVICGKNATCKYINDLYRAYNLDIYPEDGLYLPQKDEKIMCLKNNWGNSVHLSPTLDINLVNGIIGYVSNIDNNYTKADASTLTFRPTFVDDHYKPIIMDNLPFKDPRVGKKGEDVYTYYPELKKFRMGEPVDNLDYFDFAYAVTCHKSQGSEFPKVLYIDEILNRKTHYRMQYTAITRAKEKLIVAI